MPDRAQAWLARHAAEWGVPTLPPLTAVGSLIFTGASGTVLPAGIEAYAGTLRWITRAGATIPGSGAIAIPAEAEAAGTASNLAADTVLPLVSPVAGLAQQSAVVAAGGFAGGRDTEGLEAWRARILRRIRERGRAGTRTDYHDWAEEAGAAYVAVLPRWVGAGTVGVVVAMAGPRAPNTDELARIAAYIEQQRPVTATVVTLAATLLAVPVTLALSPDSVATRTAVSVALPGFFLRDAGIGRVLARSRLDEAVSSASGEYAHRIDTPSADVTPGATQLPVLDAVTFAVGGVPSPPDA